MHVALSTPAQHPVVSIVGASGAIISPASDTHGHAGTESLTVGEATMARHLATAHLGTGSGNMRLTYFTAQITQTITQIRVMSGTTAAAATPTLVRAGVYTVGGDGTLTLASAIANDTSIFAAASTAYTRTLTSSLSKVAGDRYAVGILVVTGAATPTHPGISGSLPTAEYATAPRLAGNVTGLTDLPATIAPGSIVNNTVMQYSVLLP